jgi:hypothetical protein
MTDYHSHTSSSVERPAPSFWLPFRHRLPAPGHQRHAQVPCALCPAPCALTSHPSWSGAHSATAPSHSATYDAGSADLQMTCSQSSSLHSAECDPHSAISDADVAASQLTRNQTHACCRSCQQDRSDAESIKSSVAVEKKQTDASRNGARGITLERRNGRCPLNVEQERSPLLAVG